MKISFFIVLFFLTTNVSAQRDNVTKQIQAIVKDTATGFQLIKGPFKRVIFDSVFLSKINIEGTRGGEVERIRGKMTYHTMIADSIDMDKAKDIFYDWVKKLTKGLGAGFMMDQAEASPGFASFYVKGYKFINENLLVIISHSKQPLNTKLHQVKMSFYLMK